MAFREAMGQSIGLPGKLSPCELYKSFESLGDNCEFGIVQSKHEVDALGLFGNVEFLSVKPIINGLENFFDGMFDDNYYNFFLPDGWPDWRLDCLLYGFMFHTGIPADLARGSALWEQECKKSILAFRYLKRLLLESLAFGEKIFVFRTIEGSNEAEISRLGEAIRGHGPGWLLYVEPGVGGDSARAELIDENIVRASLPLLVNEAPWRVDFAGWEIIARRCLQIREGRSREMAAASGSARPDRTSARRRLSDLTIERSEGQPIPIVQRPDEIAALFESLGDGCEFGLVQRYCGLERLGLFRFASVPHDRLSALLKSRFAELDDPEEIDVFERPGGEEWWGRVRRFGIEYHTALFSSSTPEEVALSGERKRIPFLKRKILEELESANKIFVRRDIGRKVSQMRELFATLRTYAPHRLLWVDLADVPAKVGTVELIEDSFVRAFVGVEWPDASPDPRGLKIWLQVLEGSLALLRPDIGRHDRQADVGASRDRAFWKVGGAATAEVSAEIPPPFEGVDVVEHRLIADTDVATGLALRCRVNSLLPGSLYFVSAWLWIPDGFEGSIGMVFPGSASVHSWTADMARRNCWQRIGTSFRTDATTTHHSPGILAIGKSGGRFYSTSWRFERGVAPDDDVPDRQRLTADAFR